jgi:hypothetical protein
MRDEILAHLGRAFPGRAIDELPGTAHVRGELPEFSIARIAPARGEPWVYASVGAWSANQQDAEASEFLIQSPIESPWHIDTLSTAGYFHSFYGLPRGKTLRIGWGWLPDATCQRMLVADAGVAACEGAPRVSFFRLVPITVDEEKFLKEQGQAALEARLARANLLDKKRASVVD